MALTFNKLNHKRLKRHRRWNNFYHKRSFYRRNSFLCYRDYDKKRYGIN